MIVERRITKNERRVYSCGKMLMVFPDGCDGY